MPPPPSFSMMRYWPRVSPIMAGFCGGSLSVGVAQSQRIDGSNGGFGASGRIETEHAHEACLGTEFLQRRMQTCARVSLHVQEKLILPRAAVNGAALDFEKIDIVAGKRFQRREERTRFMGESQRQRKFLRGRCRQMFRSAGPQLVAFA